jgi:GH15 family glucan-1,4-alpha-glucosidase
MNLIKKSIEVIKRMQLRNGGILATLKDGGYPYVYVRDAVFATKALNCTGNSKESEKFYYFINKYSKIKDYNEIFQRYTKEGYPSVTRKNENDNEGLLIHGIYHTFMYSKKDSFLENMWQLVKDTVDLIFRYSKAGLLKTDESIHEFKDLESGYEIWANCTAWRGLIDASEIARYLNHEEEMKKWKKKACQLEKNIKNKMFNKEIGVYVKNIKFPNAPDMSQLAPFYFGLDNSRKNLKNTMKYLSTHLWEPNLGGFRRFRKFEICDDWHWYTGGSGSWIVLTCWAAKFYRQLGDKKNYLKCKKWIEGIAKKSGGHLPEHIALKKEYDDWKSNEIEFNERIINEAKKVEKSIKKYNKHDIVYWANPLCWSHAEYILLNKEK